MALTTTPGASDANSYVSLVEAEAYVATLTFKGAWGTSDPAKEAALMQASELLGQLAWKGIRSSQAQSLAWPRKDSDGNALEDRDGYPVAVDSIPQCVKNACAEYALRLMGEDRQKDAGALVPKSLKSGTTVLADLRRQPVPPSVLEKVAQFLKATSCISLVRA